MLESIKQTSEFLKIKTTIRPKIGIILGSGLGGLVDYLEDTYSFDYNVIPNFPVSTVSGHAGKLVFGTIQSVSVLAMKGRFHFYEGYDMKTVTYPVYVMKELGIEKIIVSNAAGGANPDFSPGDLMVITDHINNMGTNPLIGKNIDSLGPRFPDLSEAYSREWRELAKEIAKSMGMSFREGVYLANTGPTYETGAEVRMARTLGADAVGMSTVPEVIVANYLGMKVLGISCITNMATGIATSKHSHSEVVAVAEMAGKKFCDWVAEIIKKS
jgi:purine-nucleoside phosphorylase